MLVTHKNDLKLSVENQAKVITLANHKGHRQSSEPMKLKLKQIRVASKKRGKTCASKSRLVLLSLLTG